MADGIAIGTIENVLDTELAEADSTENTGAMTSADDAEKKSGALTAAEETADNSALAASDADEKKEPAPAQSGGSGGKLPKKKKKDKDSFRPRKKKKWIKWVILLIIAALIGGYVYKRMKNSSKVEYKEDTATKRDITESLSFTGTIEAVSSQSVMSAVSGAKVTEVDVKEGDTVKKGDTIARLDTSDVEESIKEKQASINSSATNNKLSVEAAQQNYDNLKSNIDNGLDSSEQQAQSSVDSAFAELVSAQQAYNNEVSLNNEQLSSTILNAIQSVQSAYQQLQAKELSTDQAQDALSHAEDEYEDKNGDTDDFDSFEYDQQIDSAQLSEDQARQNYETAQTNYEAAKQNEENSLTQLYDKLIHAQNSYLSAVDSYNSTVNSNKQKLESYKLQIEQAKANGDNTVNELQLDKLEESLDDYVITAPISGEITSLDVSVGDITQVSSTTSLATITNYDKMKVSISVSEYDISNLKVGDTVTVHVDALDKDYKGTVSSIDMVGSNSSSIAYFNAEVEFVPDIDVLVGMTAEVDQTVTDAKDAVTVLSDSIMTANDGSSYVYTEDSSNPGTYKQTKVTLGSTDGTYTEIKSGVKEGEKIYYTIATVDSTDSSSGLFGSLFGGGGGMQGGGGMSGGGGGGQPGGGGGMPEGGGGNHGGGQ